MSGEEGEGGRGEPGRERFGEVGAWEGDSGGEGEFYFFLIIIFRGDVGVIGILVIGREFFNAGSRVEELIQSVICGIFSWLRHVYGGIVGGGVVGGEKG